MTDIVTDWRALRKPGLIVEEVTTVEAEVKFICSTYLCMVLRDGEERLRIMLPIGKAGSPNPLDSEMLKSVMEDSKFFTLEEIYRRRTGGTLCEPPKKRGKRNATDDTMLDSSGGFGSGDSVEVTR